MPVAWKDVDIFAASLDNMLSSKKAPSGVMRSMLVYLLSLVAWSTLTGTLPSAPAVVPAVPALAMDADPFSDPPVGDSDSWPGSGLVPTGGTVAKVAFSS